MKLYKDYRDWFTEEGIMESPYIKAFVIDAEPPSRYFDKVAEADIIESFNYFIDEFPSQEEIKDATIDLNELVESINSDGKQAGIIRVSSYMDEFDGDGDLNYLNRNLYSIDVEYDFSITMVYRAERIVAEDELTAEKIVDDFMKNLLGVPVVSEEQEVLSAYNFYHRVGVELSEGEIKVDERYIFIGTMKEEFDHTDYVKKKGYLDDLDICRHFEQEKVFIFSYQNFIENYGVEELINLGEHKQKEEKNTWTLEYYMLESQVNIVFYLIVVIVDWFLFLEE